VRNVLVLLDTGPELDGQGDLAQHLVHPDEDLAEMTGSIEDYQRDISDRVQVIFEASSSLTSRPSTSLEH
jgi:hypothetical protein